MKTTFTLSVSVMAMTAASLLAIGCGSKDSAQAGVDEALHCYVGKTMLPAMNEIAKLYEKETGQKVVMDAAGSGELLIRIRTQKAGDLYVCHDPFLDMLMAKGLGTKGYTMAVLKPVILVPKGNPKGIKSVKNLARPGIKLALTDANYSTAGHIVPEIFKKAGLDKSVLANAKRARGGGTIATWVSTGDADAGITWDAVAYVNRKNIDAVPIDPQFALVPGVDAVTSATGKKYDLGQVNVTIATLKCSKQPEAATKFAEFAVAHGAIFADQFGFSKAPGAATSPAE